MADVIAPMAQRQLAMWEQIASNWILVPTWREEQTSRRGMMHQLHFVCPNCDTSVFAASEQSFTPAVIMAATVAHIRNRHREFDPDA
jgi:hypothetical protein